MKRRIWILMAVLVLFLSGCSHSTENPEISGVSQSRETPMISVEKSEPEYAESVAFQETDKKLVTQNASSLEDGDEQSSGETVMVDETIDYGSLPESDYDGSLSNESDTQESGSSFQEVEAPPEDDSQEAELPQKTGQPEEKAPEPDPEPEDSGPEENAEEPETSEDPEPEPEPQTETVSFDIDYWISLARGMAEEKGLHLDPSAMDCWDNPITANASCIYIERDLNSRLSRYAGDEEITDVWIWYEELGNQQYLIYIGYA